MRSRIHALAGVLALSLAMHPLRGAAEDIDLFVGNNSTVGKPHVIIVLDNTSNWARQSQQWPGGETQGQSEVMAIQAALEKQKDGKVNVGLLEFVTGGNANNDGAFVRHHSRLLDDSAWSALKEKLDVIYDGINDADEKRNSNTAYGNLAYDVYNYLGGLSQDSQGVGAVYPGGVDGALADGDGYTSPYVNFKSPLTEDAVCGNTYVIYITNPNASGPTTDSSDNSSALNKLFAGMGSSPARLAGTSGGSPLPLPGFNVSTLPGTKTVLGTVDAKKCDDAIEKIAQCSPPPSEYVCTCVEKIKNKTFQVSLESPVETLVTPNNTYDLTSGTAWNLDDWSQFMYRYGVPYSSGEKSMRAKVVTYTIDVFNKQQNDDHTSLMMSAAKVGGGRYFAAKNRKAIEDALDSIFSEILSVNASFASAALPVTATNRSENENQVFIPMFRPAENSLPRWTGNMKRYQLGYVKGFLSLVDVNGNEAAHSGTGFIADCARSFWISGALDELDAYPDGYWFGEGWDLESQCTTVLAEDRFSDKPDGPFVEKGGVSEILRRGNTGDATTTVEKVQRKVLTKSMAEFTAESTGLSEDIVDFALGRDTARSNADGTKKPRRDIHGDVVHSRPQPINYGDDRGVVVFYGANDGMLRAVQLKNGSTAQAETAKELWAYVAPEHYGNLARLKGNTPIVYYFDQEAAPEPGVKEPKDYFFDGAISSLVYYSKSNTVTKAWIFATMRRGGRMLYAFDVTTPSSPTFLWKTGCPDLGSDSGCATGLEGIGQTWSVPAVALLKGYENGEKPVLVVGGGYDDCEDADGVSTSCGSSQKGSAVYILDAEDGSVRKTFTDKDMKSVPGDITLLDVDADNRADYGYLADTGGSVFRIDFINPATYEALAPEDWTLTRIAHTTHATRAIFLYGPDAISIGSAVYLTLGTGNRERPLDQNYPYVDDVQDRFYMLMDEPAAPFELVDLDGLTPVASGASGQTVSCDSPNVEPGSEYKGWYYDFAFRGEQTVTHSLIHLGTVSFSTSQAGTGTSATDICLRPLGTARSYRFNLFNGAAAWGGRKCDETHDPMPFVEMAGGGIPPSPILTTVTIDGKKVTAILGAGEKGVADVSLTNPEVRPLLRRKYWGLGVD